MARKLAVDAPEDAALRYETVNMRDIPVREHHVTANYPLEICFGSDVGHTTHNGVTRQVWSGNQTCARGLCLVVPPRTAVPRFGSGATQIPATQTLDSRNGHPILGLDDEPLWMQMSTTGPCPAGSVLLRDSRAWVSLFRWPLLRVRACSALRPRVRCHAWN